MEEWPGQGLNVLESSGPRLEPLLYCVTLGQPLDLSGPWVSQLPSEHRAVWGRRGHCPELPGGDIRGGSECVELIPRQTPRRPGRWQSWVLGAPVLSHPRLGLDPGVSRLMSPQGPSAPCSSLSLGFPAPLRVPGRPQSPALDARRSRLGSTHPRPAAATVWEKEGLKIKRRKYPCFLQIEPAPGSPWPPGQPGPDSSFEGGGGRREGAPTAPQFPAAV